ncbi:sialidase family protein [Membranihabitans marinus]|uniref:sialidase family protein n=1 Tax=Membranihabitans marinus TaxID=1227546 RepID=UPI001F2D91B7|nr:sialidase family protein [Membranihabitans marinus]
MNITLRALVFIAFWFSNLSTSSGQKEEAYLQPPMLIDNPSSTTHYNVKNRASSGIPSLAISPKGRLWAVWYVGITQGKIVEACPSSYIAVVTSGDQGETWEEVLAIDPDEAGPVRGFDPEVWFDPDGKLWVFWAQQLSPARKTRSGVWAITTEDGDSAKPKWSKPRRLIDGVMMCKPTVLSSGEWALPVSFWHEEDKSSKIVTSTNRGKSWKEKGYVSVPEEFLNWDENMIFEKNDGSLSMWVRTKYGIGESYSKDGGRNWSTLKPSKIAHTSSRFFVRRLTSGNLLMVKHGPLSERTKRSHLMAFISQDDGSTWSNGLLLDEREGISYPDGDQAEDGTIYITYDFSRSHEQHILMTSFTEEDILSKNYDANMYKVYKNRKLISDGGN